MNFRLIFNSILPGLILLFLFITGTKPSQYWSNFRTEEGQINGPYVLIFEEFRLVIPQDSMDFSERLDFDKELSYHELFKEHRKVMEMVKRADSTWGNRLLSKVETFDRLYWDSLLVAMKEPVFRFDTVFTNDIAYKVEIPMTYRVIRKPFAKVVFSLGENDNYLGIRDYNWLEDDEDDEYGLKDWIKYSVRGTPTHNSVESILDHLEFTREVLAGKEELTATRLDTKYQLALAYILENDGVEFYYDKNGFEGLEYETKENGMIDVLNPQGNGKFILWYDHWYVYALALLQVITFLGLRSEFNKRNESRKSS